MSDINYLSINEDFPVAGQDNDTQTFRDNFNTIKTSLGTAKDEITALEDSAARLNVDNDFQGNIITNAVIQDTIEKKFDGATITSSRFTVDFENGSYQIYKFGADCEIDFLSFPDNNTPNTGVGRITLELTGDGTTRTLTFVSSDGIVFKKNSGFPAPFTVENAENPVFVEVWKHDSEKIFLKYVGQFS